MNNKNSIALWYDDELKVELDTNISIVPENNFIEFGIKVLLSEYIKEEKKDYKVNLYIPFEIKNSNIRPINLSDNLPLIKAMFNEKININIEKYVNIEYKKKEYNKSFCLRSFKDKKLEKSENSEGTIIRIIVKHSIKNNKCKGYYYRFRINKLNAFFNSDDKNLSFQDGFLRKNEIIDFAINKMDRLSEDIINEMKHYETKIYRSNIFIIVTERHDLMEDEGYYQKKSASDIWRKHYVINDNIKDKIIIYHYKGKNNLFLKFESNRKKWIIGIVLIIAIIAIVASFKTLLCPCK